MSFDKISFPIYRYTKKRFFNSFYLQGAIRMGTLYGYHEVERLGSDIGDITEGAKLDYATENIDVATCLAGNSINSWLLSMCKSKDDRFYDRFDVDCCVEISDPMFFEYLAQAASDRAWCGSLLEVRYGNIAQAWVDRLIGDDPLLLLQWKPIDFAWQNEVRFVLEPWSPLAPKAEKLEEGSLDDATADLLWKLGPQVLAYSYPRNFPNLQPLMLYAPKAIPYAKIVEART